MGSLTDEIREDIAAGGALAEATARGLFEELRGDVDRALVALDAAKRGGDVAWVEAARADHRRALERLGRFVAEEGPPQDAEADVADAVEALYHEAVAADDALTAALEARYGAAAGDRRYWPTFALPVEIQTLAEAKIDADAAYLGAVRALRDGSR